MAEATNLYDLNRKERGAIFASEFDVEQSHRGWRVPSQSGSGTYVVTVEDVYLPGLQKPRRNVQAHPRRRIHERV